MRLNTTYPAKNREKQIKFELRMLSSCPEQSDSASSSCGLMGLMGISFSGTRGGLARPREYTPSPRNWGVHRQMQAYPLEGFTLLTCV